MVNGGDGNYSYKWYNEDQLLEGENQSILDNLTQGRYYVELIDGNGIILKRYISLVDPLELMLNEFRVYNVSCFGAEDGRIQAELEGGTKPYSLDIIDSTDFFSTYTDFNIDNRTPGSYTINMSDYCNQKTYDTTIIITQPNEITTEIKAYKPNSPNGNDGTIKMKINGIYDHQNFQSNSSIVSLNH